MKPSSSSTTSNKRSHVLFSFLFVFLALALLLLFPSPNTLPNNQPHSSSQHQHQQQSQHDLDNLISQEFSSKERMKRRRNGRFKHPEQNLKSENLMSINIAHPPAQKHSQPQSAGVRGSSAKKADEFVKDVLVKSGNMKPYEFGSKKLTWIPAPSSSPAVTTPRETEKVTEDKTALVEPTTASLSEETTTSQQIPTSQSATTTATTEESHGSNDDTNTDETHPTSFPSQQQQNQTNDHHHDDQHSTSSTRSGIHVPDQVDVLPEYNEKMKTRIRKGHAILRDLPAPPVRSEDSPSKAHEVISDEEIFSWTSSNDKSRDSSSTSSLTEAQKARIKFVQTVSSMLELFPTAANSSSDNNNNNNDHPVTTHYSYARPFLRFKLNSDHSQQPEQQKARMACLYAGFTRDFDLMLRTCTKSKKKCMSKKIRRNFGYQWDRLVNPSDCDVFMSTWHLVGAGRYFTTAYDQNSLIKPANHWMFRLNDRLAAIHVHKYDAYGDLWKAAHRFPRKFPQIHTGPESRMDAYRRMMDQTRMFPTVNAENKYMRLNDYSQSFKHYTAVLLTWSYETWAKGSYDVYLRLRTDERAVRQIMPTMPISSVKPESNNNNNSNDNVPLVRTAMIELCPAAKYGKGGGHPAVAHSATSKNENTDDGSVSAEQSGGDGKNVANKDDMAGGEKHTCDKHSITAATSLPHLNPSDPNSRADFDKLFFTIYKNQTAHLQKVGINSFDIADFAYLGSPEIISYFGGHLWDLCTTPTSSPDGKPSFYPDLVNKFSNTGDYKFSEYNLMLWRMILDAGWSRDTLYYLVRISRASMPSVRSGKK